MHSIFILPSDGFSNKQLELLAANPRPIAYGKAPWVKWESENAGMGVSLRESHRISSLLPLFFHSDHGVSLIKHIEPSEFLNPELLYLTSNKSKYLKLLESGRRTLRLMHPWVSWHRIFVEKKIDSSKRVGTLVFYPHSNSRTIAKIPNLDKYFLQLKSLPSKFHPIFICLMSHDINLNTHLMLREHKLPIVTAGNSSSIHFIKRFFNLTSQFRYATSPSIGSHFYYSLINNLKFFFLGDVDYQTTRFSHLPQGIKVSVFTHANEEEEAILKKVHAKLNIDEVENSIDDFIKEHLKSVLGLGDVTNSEIFKTIAYEEFFRNYRKLPNLYISNVIKLLKIK